MQSAGSLLFPRHSQVKFKPSFPWDPCLCAKLGVMAAPQLHPEGATHSPLCPTPCHPLAAPGVSWACQDTALTRGDRASGGGCGAVRAQASRGCPVAVHPSPPPAAGLGAAQGQQRRRGARLSQESCSAKHSPLLGSGVLTIYLGTKLRFCWEKKLFVFLAREVERMCASVVPMPRCSSPPTSCQQLLGPGRSAMAGDCRSLKGPGPHHV